MLHVSKPCNTIMHALHRTNGRRETHSHFEGGEGARGGGSDGVGVIGLPLQAHVSLTVAQVSNGEELHRALAICWCCCEVELLAEACGLQQDNKSSSRNPCQGTEAEQDRVTVNSGMIHGLGYI